MCITNRLCENYSVVEQNEVQSVYWSKNSLSIFAAHAWAKPCTYQMPIISNELSHINGPLQHV